MPLPHFILLLFFKFMADIALGKNQMLLTFLPWGTVLKQYRNKKIIIKCLEKLDGSRAFRSTSLIIPNL